MRPFEIDDIEDVRILIKAKGKHYSIHPDRDLITDEEAKDLRIKILARLVLPAHKIFDQPLENLKEK